MNAIIQNNYLSGILLAIIGTFFFALKSIFIKFAYIEGTNAEVLLTLRMLIAMPFYIGMLYYLKQRQLFKTPLTPSIIARISLYGFFGYYLASYLDLMGLEYISAQLERLTLLTYPAIVTLLAWLFLKERITALLLFSLLITYIGVFLIYYQEQDVSGSHNTLWGVLLVFGSAFSYALYIMLSKPMIHKVGSRAFTAIAMLGSTIFVLVQFILTKPISDLNVSVTIWIYATLLAFVSTVIPSFMISEAISRIGAARTGILGTVGPVFTIALAIFLLDEPFGWTHFIGMTLVLIGVSVVSCHSPSS